METELLNIENEREKVYLKVGLKNKKGFIENIGFIKNEKYLPYQEFNILGLQKDEKIEKYSLKTKEGNLIALGAYRVMGRKAYVYILYLESAPASNPTLTAKREYYGIGEVMIAFGIKFSIDSGCRGDVLFEAKTPELARHYEKDFHARQVATLNSGGPQRYMLADENAWNLFEKFLAEEEP